MDICTVVTTEENPGSSSGGSSARFPPSCGCPTRSTGKMPAPAIAEPGPNWQARAKVQSRGIRSGRQARNQVASPALVLKKRGKGRALNHIGRRCHQRVAGLNGFGESPLASGGPPKKPGNSESGRSIATPWCTAGSAQHLAPGQTGRQGYSGHSFFSPGRPQ